MYKKRERKQALVKQYMKNKRLQDKLDSLNDDYEILLEDFYGDKDKIKELRVKIAQLNEDIEEK